MFLCIDLLLSWHFLVSVLLCLYWFVAVVAFSGIGIVMFVLIVCFRGIFWYRYCYVCIDLLLSWHFLVSVLLCLYWLVAVVAFSGIGIVMFVLICSCHETFWYRYYVTWCCLAIFWYLYDSWMAILGLLSFTITHVYMNFLFIKNNLLIILLDSSEMYFYWNTNLLDWLDHCLSYTDGFFVCNDIKTHQICCQYLGKYTARVRGNLHVVKEKVN